MSTLFLNTQAANQFNHTDSTINKESHFIDLNKKPQNDSIKYSDLNEFVVEGKYSNLDGYTITYYPTKSEKNHSNSPAGLIERMHIPSLIVQDNQITTGNGKGVTIFINSEIVSSTELATFWAKEVKSVEYIEQSDDPRYANYLPCVNFITQKYIWGGVTSINTSQEIPGLGNYNVASKYTNDKITISAKAGFNYHRLHNVGSMGEEVFKDFYLDGEPITSVLKQYDENSLLREDHWNAAINIKYADDKKILNHTISYVANKNPETSSIFKLDWTPSIIKEDNSQNKTTSLRQMPSIMARYNFSLSPSLSLDVAWNYGRSISNSNSSYILPGYLDITNDVKENADIASIGIAISKILNSKINLGASINTAYENYRTQYLGNTDSKVNTWKSDNNLKLIMDWRISDYFNLSASPALTFLTYKTSLSKHTNLWTPNGEIALNFSDRRQFMAGLNLYYFRFSPSPTSLADISIQENEILWIKGNPSIKPSEMWSVGFNGMWLGNRYFSISTSLNWNINVNDQIKDYNASDSKYGGIVSSYVNSPLIHFIHWRTNLRYRIKNITLWAMPFLMYSHATGEYSKSLISPRYTLGGDYTLGNFMFQAYYDSKYKTLISGGMGKYTHPENWNIGVSYSNGNFQASISGRNLFKHTIKDLTTLSSPHYTSTEASYHQGRTLILSLSYTFGYGKKVNEYIDIETSDAIKTSILGMDE